jgi:hypothetical protein
MCLFLPPTPPPSLSPGLQRSEDWQGAGSHSWEDVDSDEDCPPHQKRKKKAPPRYNARNVVGNLSPCVVEVSMLAEVSVQHPSQNCPLYEE